MEKKIEDKNIDKNKTITEENKTKSEIDKLKEKNIILLAEMENLRKSHAKDKQELGKYFLSSFLQKLLPSLEMFESALNSKNVSEEIKNWLIGFEMINKNINLILEENGVSKINVKKGDNFNSKFHYAVDEQFSKEFKKGKILEIKQNGYLINDRLLKPITVIVSKGQEDQK